MSLQQYLTNMKNIQSSILQYIDSEYNFDDYYKKLIQIFNTQKIGNNPSVLQQIVKLIFKIMQNHRRTKNFYEKFGKIVNYFKKDILKNFSNQAIYNIFYRNKRLLLILIEEKILKVDELIANEIYNYKDSYRQYFYNEIKPFISKEKLEKYSIDEYHKFEEQRKLAENHNKICEIIRNDSVDDFISFVKKNNIEFDKLIPSSIFQVDNGSSYIIEYAALCGSVQIFQYLINEKIRLPYEYWKYIIRSRNPQMIFILEESNVELNKICYGLFIESIKCYHNDIANYIQDSYEIPADLMKNRDFFESFNFAFITPSMINKSLYYIFQYDYLNIVEILLKNSDFDVNMLVILLIKLNKISNYCFK